MKKNIFNERSVCELLRTFSKQEARDFEGFLKYKGSSNVVKLWELLRKKHPAYVVKDTVLYKGIKPSKIYNDGIFRGWVSELYQLAREYAAFLEFQSNEHLHANTMQMSLLKRRAQATYQKTIPAATERYAPQQPLHVNHYTHWHQKEDIQYQYVTLFHHRETTDSLQRASDVLDYTYAAHKLKYLVTMRNRQRIVNEAYDYRGEEILLAYLAHFPLADHPLLETYRLLLRLFQAIDNEAAFHRFKDFLLTHQKVIHVLECRQLITFASNICYWNIGEGRLSFLSPRFDLTKMMVEEGYLLIQGVLPSYQFRSIMRAAVEAKELDWAAHFLKNNLPLTRDEDRPNLEALNQAYLFFALGQYEAQAPFMQRMNSLDYCFENKYNEIAFRILRLKTDYCLLSPQPKPIAQDAFRSRLDNFRHYLNRQEGISPSFIESCQNFRRALALVFQDTHRKRELNLNLTDTILAKQPIGELPWLLEQCTACRPII